MPTDVDRNLRCAGDAVVIVVHPPNPKLETVFAVFGMVCAHPEKFELAGVYSSEIAAKVVAGDLPGPAYVTPVTLDALPKRRL